MKKALLSLLLALAFVPMAFSQSKAGQVVVINDTVCGSFTWDKNGVTYHSDTVVTCTKNGTTYVLNLTMMTPTFDSVVADTLTGNCFVTWKNMKWNTNGIHYDTTATAEGCAIVQHMVQLTLVDTLSLTATACGHYVAPWDDTIKNSIVKEDSNFVAQGCNYNVDFNLTINPIYHMDTVEAEGGCSYSWNGMTITDTNVHSKTLASLEGCDSIVSIKVSLTNLDFDTVKIVRCDRYITGGDTITADTMFTVLDTAHVCHVERTTLVTINPSYKDSSSVVIPQVTGGCTISWMGHTYTYANANSTQWATAHTVEGNCDSLVAIHITTFDSVQRDTVDVVGCGKYRWRNTDYSVAGTYSDTATSATCTNIYTLNLTFAPRYDSVTARACEMYTYTFDSRRGVAGARDQAFFTESGTYVTDTTGDTLYTKDFATGCITYHKVIAEVQQVSKYWREQDLVDTACVTYTYKFNNRNTTVTNNDTLPSIIDRIDSAGRREYGTKCYDSLLHVMVTLNPKTFLNYPPVTKCDSYTWEFNNTTYTESKVLERKLTDTTNHYGCDSIGRLNLTINYTPEVVIEGEWNLDPRETNKTTLKAVCDQNNVRYQWFKDNDTLHVWKTDAEVEVEVTANTDIYLKTTSAKGCIAQNWITVTLGIEDAESMQVNIYPNPASRFLNVDSEEGIETIVIYNVLGQVVRSQEVNANHIQIDLGNLAAGNYTLRINALNGEQTTRKIIINK